MKHHGIISQFPDIFINGRDGFAVNRFVISKFNNKEMKKFHETW